MKRILVIGLVMATLGLAGSFAIPAFAHDPGDGAAGGSAWETMHEACANGDWEAMTEAAEEVHGANPGEAPCPGDYDGEGGHMGGGMMGGGMMGWR